jgi:hypothetical protein
LATFIAYQGFAYVHYAIGAIEKVERLKKKHENVSN